MSLVVGIVLSVVLYVGLVFVTHWCKPQIHALARKANHIVPLKRRNGYRNSETGGFVSTQWVRDVEKHAFYITRTFVIGAIAIVPTVYALICL